MRQEIRDRVDTFAESMLLHYASPNKDLIVEIMQLDASNINILHYDQLSKYILVLGQYLVMLQHNENMKNMDYMLVSKAFEHQLNKEKFSREDVQGKTEKERRAWLVINVPELEELQQQVLVAEAEKMVISGMVRANEGLLNALKKELSVRFSSSD